eukprot:PhM_4_TR156/c0_g1_i3/m.61434/K00432/gpx; glutathione peroxidase
MFRFTTSTLSAATAASVYDFVVKDLRGREYPMRQHEGQVLLIMNVASQCGYTASGYDTANALFDRYKDKKFNVLAFPCNQFGGQEPGSNEQIAEFCSMKKAAFPIMDKVEVNGKGADPLWDYMKHAAPGILGTTSIKWNFTKFLVDRNGQVRFRYAPGDKTEIIEKDLLTLI